MHSCVIISEYLIACSKNILLITVKHTSSEKKRLQYFASPEGRDHLYQYNQKESRTVLEVRKASLKLFLNNILS